MRSTLRGSSRARQCGKAGAIMALVSILIIAALAKVTLAQFGLTAQKEVAGTKATPGASAVALDADDDEVVAAGATSLTATTRPTPPNTIDKARAVQGIVERQAAETAARIESEGK